MLNYNEIKLFTKHMSNLCRVVNGFLRTDLSILMLGHQKENVSFRELIAAMKEGRRGVIFIGDINNFYGNGEVANFIDWCKEKKLVNSIDAALMTKL